MNIRPISFKSTKTIQKKENKTDLETKRKRNRAIAAAAAVAIPTTFFAIGIGRNPVKAAKFLRGNQEIRENAYKRGLEILDEVVNKTGDFKTKLSDINLKEFLKDCPAEILPKDNIYYHGTRRSRGIYKKGFTPFASWQVPLYQRELGAGVYVTPNEKVAYNFKRITGKIIPVKVENAKIATIEPDDMIKVYKKIDEFLSERMNPMDMIKRTQYNAFQELFVRKLFTDAGYDGVYLSKAITNGKFAKIIPDTNKVFGIDQSQLVLFNAEKLEIQSRDIKERFFDIGRGAKAQYNQIKNIYVESYRMLKNLLDAKYQKK